MSMLKKVSLTLAALVVSTGLAFAGPHGGGFGGGFHGGGGGFHGGGMHMGGGGFHGGGGWHGGGGGWHGGGWHRGGGWWGGGIGIPVPIPYGGDSCWYWNGYRWVPTC